MEELSPQTKVLLREKQTELIHILDAFAKLEESKEWKVIREHVYEKSFDAIQREIMNASLSQEIDTAKLYKLQGEWSWAKQFCEPGRFVEMLKKQLEDIKTKLK